METIPKVSLPERYNKRYSLEYLAWQRKLNTGQEIREMVQTIAAQLEVTPRTIYNWMKQEQDSEISEISGKARRVCAAYFGIAPDQILSENCDQKATIV